MNIEESITRLNQLYQQFEEEARGFKKEAVCQKGCADCCKHMPRIEATTLEGFVIFRYLDRVENLAEIRKKLKKDIQKRKKGKYATCPFLARDDSCLIYEVRPFSCRWLYSLKKCEKGMPVIHRQVFNLSQKIIKGITQLDVQGYTGHLSFIVSLFAIPGFKEAYLKGKSTYPFVQKLVKAGFIRPNWEN